MTFLSKPKHPAYHLRPNKAVDRLLFVEIMRALDAYTSITEDFTYIGFAGPFLEDARLVAQNYPRMRQISVEQDEQTYKRQKFHQCSSRLVLKNMAFEDFLSTDFPEGRTIVWADYTDLNRKALLEVSDIARKAVPLSLLRVTVRGETPVFNETNIPRRMSSLPKIREVEFLKFTEKFANRIAIPDVSYDQGLFTWKNFSVEEYPWLVARLIESVIEGACTQPKKFIPLHAVKYSDGTIMLSLTGVFCAADNFSDLAEHFRRAGVLKNTPIPIEAIDLPVLTTKERLYLESSLPAKSTDGKGCQKQLGYLIEGDNSEELSTYKLSQYEKYHRFYPFFGRLIP